MLALRRMMRKGYPFVLVLKGAIHVVPDRCRTSQVIYHDKGTHAHPS